MQWIQHDIFSGQKTIRVLDAMEERHIIPVYIPDGCAGYVQPMNTILNNLVKDKTADILEELLEADEEIDDSVGHRSIMITQCS